MLACMLACAHARIEDHFRLERGVTAELHYAASARARSSVRAPGEWKQASPPSWAKLLGRALRIRPQWQSQLCMHTGRLSES
eukprot:355041-Chlamydomonas_euryale.AAC.16